MLSDAQVERYSRQIVLPEVGGRGQQRLLASSVSIRGDRGAALACASYLAAAGVGRISIEGVDRAEVGRWSRNPDCKVSSEPMPAPDVEVWIASLPAGAPSAGTTLLWGAASEREVVRARFQPGEACRECLRALSPERSGGHASPLLGTLLAAEALRALLGLACPPGAEVVRLDLERTGMVAEPLPHPTHS